MTGNNDRPNDPLMDRLHREALAERPPFSEALHSRIMQDAKDAKPFRLLGALGVLAVIKIFNRQDAKSAKKLVQNGDAASLKLAASPFLRIAALLLAPIGLIALWTICSRHIVSQNLAVSIREPEMRHTPRPVAIFDRFDLGGVVSARLFPPEIQVQLPVIAVPPSLPESQNSQAQTTSVFDSLDAPTNHAIQTIADMVPPSLRAMVKLAQSATFADTHLSK